MLAMLKPFIHTELNFVVLIVSILFAIFVGILLVYYSRLRKSYLSRTDVILQQFLGSFTPEPLIVESDNDDVVSTKPNVVTDIIGTKINIYDKEYFNFASNNYLNIIGNNNITSEAIKTIKKYGVGSCGPRGFYGTVDVHLDLEDRIARFMNMEEAVVYSYGFSTIASAIPAYCKRNDVIFCDEEISFAAQKGIDAVRCQVIYFNHNNPKDLEEKLEQFHKKYAQKKVIPRKFLVLEGIYVNTGNICNLPELIRLRRKFEMRLFLDESLSIGLLGKTGRGITEHLNVNPEEVDLIIGSLEGLIGSIGGFCVGSHFIIEHQRLSGLGYCFSASLPPVLTRAAYCAFDYIDENSEKVCEDIRTQCTKIHDMLQKISNAVVTGHPIAPVKFLSFENLSESEQRQDALYKQFSEKCFEKGLLVNIVKNFKSKKFFLKFAVNVSFTETVIKESFLILSSVAEEIFHS